MEVIKKSPRSPKSKHDQWCFKALGAQRRGTPKTTVLMQYDFSKDFDPERLKKIKTESDRGRFKGRLGSFKSVVEQAEKTNELFVAYKQETKVKKGGFFSKKTEVSLQEMIGKFQELIKDAEEWRGHFSEEGERQKTGVVSDKSVQPDKYRVAKMQACEDMIQGARASIAQLKLIDLSNNDESIERASARLTDIRMRAESHSPNEGDMERGRNLDAFLLGKVCGVKYPDSGTSEVGLIKGIDDSVVYAFKSVEGESDQTGLPKGSGAAREMLMSRLCDQIMEDQELDFKWPKTSMAMLPAKNGEEKIGVLIEGIQGTELFDPMGKGNLKLSQKELAEKKDGARKIIAKIPPAEIQKLVLCNLAFGQYDTKWENCMIQEDGDSATAVPFDGGAAFPDLNLFMDTVNMGAVPGTGLITYASEDMNVVSEGQEMPMSQTLVSPELRQMFMAIDEKALLKSAADELDRLPEDFPRSKALGMDVGLNIMVKSIQGMKLILKQNPKITMVDFLAAYKKEVIEPLGKQYEGQWAKQVYDDYIALQQKNPGLLTDRDDKTTARSIRANYLMPAQQKYLGQIKALGGPAFLTGDELSTKVKCPLALYQSFQMVMTDLVGKRLTPEQKLRYPEVFPSPK